MRSLVQLGKHSYFSLVSCPKTCEEDMRKIRLVQPKLKLTILVNNRNPAQKRSSQNPPKVLLLTWTECFIFSFYFCDYLCLPKFFIPSSGQIFKWKCSFKMRSWKDLSGEALRGKIFVFFSDEIIYLKGIEVFVFFMFFQRGFPSDLF